MPAKNYYVVLGVSRDESSAGICSAYHELAQHQPAGWATTPEPISLLGQPAQTKPSFDAFRDRYLRNFTGRNMPKSERAEGLTLDVALSPAEAFHGCTVPVGVPEFGICSQCGGTGHVCDFQCLECAGSGLLEQQRTLYVHVPPQVQPATVLEMPLEMFGIRNLYLRMQVSISDAL